MPIITPQDLVPVLDGITLLLAAFIVIQIVRSSLGGAVGSAFRYILGSILVFTGNRLFIFVMNRFFFSITTGEYGHGFLQPQILNRGIEIFGFVLMTIGLRKLTSTKMGAPK